MAQHRVTLILGAGASFGYGFPLGIGLSTAIWKLANDMPAAAHRLMFNEATIRRFLETFRQSQSFSIDAFLARRGEFAEVGKRSIASVILGCEERERLFTPDEASGHWYQWLVKYLYDKPWDDLDLGWLSVVTFNYDRSLEMYLMQTMIATYNKSEEEAHAKLQELQVLHVYGQLGPLMGDGRIAYRADNAIDSSIITSAAASLKVIPEGRDDDAILAPIRESIGHANFVAFLGFGFDRHNLRRLGFPEIWSATKPIGGTCIGMTAVEQSFAAHLAIGSDLAFQNSKPGGWVNGNCADYLRQTGLLESLVENGVR